MRKYLAILRGQMMRGLAYRSGFFISIVGNLVFIGVLYYLWRSVYSGRDQINGLTFDQTLLYVALGSTVFILLKTHVDWLMSFEIREGAVVIYLIKPVDYQMVMLTFSAGSSLLAAVIVTAPTIALLVWGLGIGWPIGVGTALAPLALILAFLISFCFDYTVGLSGFYTESMWGLGIVKDTLVVVLSGALIPLQFFPESLREILLWLPFQAVYHAPLMMITQPDRPLGVQLTALGVQALWAVALFGLTRLFYSRAIRVLRIAGG